MNKTETSIRIAAAARHAWSSASDLRSRRQRAKRFTYGDQWSDPTTDRNGRKVTEAEKARSKGREPMTNNLIRRLVKCIVGHFRLSLNAANSIENRPADDNLNKVLSANSIDEIDARMLEEFLISGCAIQRIVAERRSHGKGVWVDNVNPASFFVNSFCDPRGWDIELVGMLHNMSPAEAVMRFAHGDRTRALKLRQHLNTIESYGDDNILGSDNSNSFSYAPDNRLRIIEVWTLEASEELCCHDPLNGSFTTAAANAALISDINDQNNSRRNSGLPLIATKWQMTTRWHCRWMTPDGTILDEYDSPHSDGRHPFIVKFHPMTDGEVHSLVEDVIDQQIYVNNLITMINHIMNCSAKGALLFPVDSKIDNMEWSRVASMWALPDAVIPYKPGAGGKEPHQVSSNATDIGARELLALEIQMFEDVSGVSNALMGKTTGSGNVGVDRYESEVRNALVAIKDILDTFNHFRTMRNETIMSLLQNGKY